MSLYVLDTDTLSLLQDGNPSVVQRVGQVSPAELAITVISVEEQLTGWYTRLRRRLTHEQQAFVYDELRRTVGFLGRLPILAFTVQAIDRFEQLRRMKLNVASQDLRIAAIALENSAVVVSRNLRDFQRVPGLHVENWAA
jgi:tRNA(fMet)-specific endonuclease VapC